MSFLEWLSNRYEREAKHWSYVVIDPGHVDMGSGQKFTDDRIVAGQHYFQVWLAEMFIKNDRKWLSSVHPAVYSALRLRYGNADEQLSHIAGQSGLKSEINNTNLGQAVEMNHPITSLLPFNGGSVELESGLLAVEGENDVKTFLKVLGDFSKLLVVPQLSTILAVASPLAAGISELIGATNAKPLLRLRDSWTGKPGDENPFRRMYFTVIASEAAAMPPETLWVKNGKLRVGPSLAASQPLTGTHYMLFRIDCVEERDDWDSLTLIQEPYAQAIEMLQGYFAADPDAQKNIIEEADRRFNSAVFAAYRSKELTKIAGRRQVVDALRQRYAEDKKNLAIGAFEAGPTTSLNEIMKQRMSFAEAANLPEIQESELWDTPNNG